MDIKQARKNLTDILVALGMAEYFAKFEADHIFGPVYNKEVTSSRGFISRIVLMPDQERETAFAVIKERIALLVPFMKLLGYNDPLRQAISLYNGLPIGDTDNTIVQGTALVALGALSTEEEQKDWITNRLTGILGSEEDYYERGSQLANLVLQMDVIDPSNFPTVFHIAGELAGKGYLTQEFEPTKGIDFGKWAYDLVRRDDAALQFTGFIMSEMWSAGFPATWDEYEKFLEQQGLTEANFVANLLNHEMTAYMWRGEFVDSIFALFLPAKETETVEELD